MQHIWEDWGRRVREARKDADYTQVTFAEALDISQQRISQLETGQLAPRDELKIRIARLLKRRISDLFPLPDDSDGDEEAA
jgi:DNA-binding XRE family transcriptional regulator